MVSPQGQAMLAKTKEDWLTAAKHARSQKEKAQKEYNQQKDVGIVENQTFEQWAPQNYPAFSVAYSQYQATAAAYTTALNNFDQEGANEWQKEYQRQYNEKYYGSGEDKGSQFLIITPEE